MAQRRARGQKSVVVRVVMLAHGEGLALPAYQTDEAAGLDLVAAVPADAPVTLAPGRRALIPTGLQIELPVGFEAQVRPRSGLALKHGVTCLNTPGTIDADYRGEVGVILANLGDAPFLVGRGDRIAQLVVAPVTRAVLRRVGALSTTRRGAGGFGSTRVRSEATSKAKARTGTKTKPKTGSAGGSAAKKKIRKKPAKP